MRLPSRRRARLVRLARPQTLGRVALAEPAVPFPYVGVLGRRRASADTARRVDEDVAPAALLGLASASGGCSGPRSAVSVDRHPAKFVDLGAARCEHPPSTTRMAGCARRPSTAASCPRSGRTRVGIELARRQAVSEVLSGRRNPSGGVTTIRLDGSRAGDPPLPGSPMADARSTAWRDPAPRIRFDLGEADRHAALHRGAAGGSPSGRTGDRVCPRGRDRHVPRRLHRAGKAKALELRRAGKLGWGGRCGPRCWCGSTSG